MSSSSPVSSMPRSSNERISGLASWARNRRRDSRAATAGSLEVVGRGSTVTAAVAVVGDDGEAPSPADRPGSPSHDAARRRHVEGVEHRHVSAAPVLATTSATSGWRSSVDGTMRALGPRASARRSSKRAELEEVEQPLDLGRRRRCITSSPGDVDRRVAAQHGDVVVLAHPLPRARPATPASFGVRSSRWAKTPSRPPYVVDQLGGRLLPDPGNAGQVVARVAAQGGVLGILRRRDAGALDDAGLVVEHVVADAAAVVEHLDVRVARRAGRRRGRR